MADILDLYRSTGLEPKRSAATNGGEYKGPCPGCGGDDRFILWPNRQYKNCVGGYFCRQCDESGDFIAFCRTFLDMTWKEALGATDSTVQIDASFVRPVQRNPIARPVISPCKKWIQSSDDLVKKAADEIHNRSDMLEFLANRGIPVEAVQRYRIGYINNPYRSSGDMSLPRSDFGLPEECRDDGEPKKVWIPKGILIPSAEPSGTIIRLKVRRSNYQPEDNFPKYIAVPGSMGGLCLIGDRSHKVLVVVESELDGYAVHYAVGDLALVVAVGSNSKNPDAYTDFLAKKSKTILVCHDNDKGGGVMRDKWAKLYSQARSYPCLTHKDIGDAAKDGVDIREWILAGLNAID